MRLRDLLTAAPLVLALGCDGEASDPTGIPDNACGIVACTDDMANFEPAELPGGGAYAKADADNVEAALAQLTTDGVLDAVDVPELYAAAGETVKPSEIAVIRDALSSTDFEVTPEADALARYMARTLDLSDAERSYHEAGLTYAQTAVPEAVTELLARARLNGAVAYDVNERDADGEGLWSPYPATTPPTHNMAFDYTMITPEGLAADLADTAVEYNAIVGAEQGTLPDGRTYERAKYEPRVGGTGNIAAHYDHVYHPDIYARGSQGQKWASNCGILSDGSIHCLPAARRSVAQDLILTNPHLSRGARMLYNGHITARGGVITSVEMSGRLAKRAARGKAIFVDPVAFLEAWGFEVAPNVTVHYGNTEDGVPYRDLEGGVIRQADEPEADEEVLP